MAVLALTLSCGQSEPAPFVQGLDETLPCPEGFVGWNFRTHPVQSVTAESSDSIALVAPFAVNIDSVSCAEGDGGSALATALRSSCDGERTCATSIPANSGCTGAVTVSYQCGFDDVDASGAPALRTATATAGTSAASIALDCTPAAAAAEELPERSACIPRNCHGQTRRDENLGCVPDATMPVVDHPVARLTVGTTVPLMADTTAVDRERLVSRATYPLTVELDIPGTRENVPESARVTIWLADQLVSVDSEPPYTPTEEGWAFRCQWVQLEAGQNQIVGSDEDSVQVRVSGEFMLPDSCTNAVAIANLAGSLKIRHGIETPSSFDGRRLGTDGLGLNGTQVFASYDMDGQASVVLGSETATTTCAPNPAGFFYDGELRQFDMFGYLSQRRVAVEEREPSSLENPRRSFPTGGNIYVGPTEFSLGDAEMAMGPTRAERAVAVEVTNQPTRSPAIPVSIGWYAAHIPDSGIRFAGRDLNMKARVHIWPSDRAGEETNIPTVGTVDLGNFANREGSSVSVEVPLLANVRSAMYDPTSPLYVDPEIYGNTRAFDVFYCLESEPNVDRTLTRPIHYARGEGMAYNTSAQWTPPRSAFGIGRQTVRLLRLAPVPADSPAHAWSSSESGRVTANGAGGCAFAQSPLVVTLDRELRSQPVVGNSLYPGQATSRASGSSVMRGVSDTDTVSVCTEESTACRESAVGQMVGQGNMALSYYSFDVNVDHDTSSDGGRSTTSGNVLGFMALSPEEESDEFTPSVASPSTPISVTVTPPWDDIRSALVASTMTPPGSLLRREWRRASYAGIMGLGLGIGFQKRVQVGPIPGVIILTATAGVGLEGTISLQFAGDDGEAYPCVGESENCVQLGSDPLSLGEAAEACYIRGGRLTDFRNAAEAAAFREAMEGENANFWIGAQASYRHPVLDCLGDSYVARRCASNMRTNWRWLADDAIAASSIGAGRASFTPTGVSTASSITSPSPAAAGLAFNAASEQVIATDESTGLGYACTFDPVERAAFLKWAIEIKMSTGAGLALAFCAPSDDPGICLEGSLNFITFSLATTLSQTNHFLYRDGYFGVRSNLNFQIPWAISILEGAITAKIQASIFSFSYPIVSFDGLKLGEGTLLDINAPTHVDYEL